MASATSANGVLRTTLENGLSVIIQPERGVPIGSFWIWYRVGGRNELPGVTGLSHWVEHLLFKGTDNFPSGEIFRQISAAGGTLNGFTWIDYTAYFETLPIDRIDLAASIEADRMANTRFDPEEVESERTVIISERQGNENQPTFFLREEVAGTAFRVHSYGQSVIGHLADLQGITFDDLINHYRIYYRPNNAIAVFVGDLDAADALKLINENFGGLEPGPEVPRVRMVEPTPHGERRITVRRPAPNRVLMIVYPAPRAESEDTPALMVLDAILSGGKPFSFSGAGGTIGRSSRMYRKFVTTGLASSAGSALALTIDPYLFSLSATLPPETDAQEFEELMIAELHNLRNTPVADDELDRAIRQLRAQFAYALESVTSRAYLLGSLAIVAPEREPEMLIEDIAAVTADDVVRVAENYLKDERRTVGWLFPTES